MNKLISVENVEKIIYPKEGGILAQVKGDKFPRKGFPTELMVEFALPAVKGLIPMVAKYGSKMMRKYNMNPERYCRCVRELHRVLSIASERAAEKHIKEKILDIRDTVCPTLELDDFYRNIFQDIAEEIHWEELFPDEGDKYFRKEKGKRYNFKEK